MNHQLKAVLFDLDGVVFDTEPQYSLLWGAICRKYHPEIPGLENKIKGQTLTQIFDGFFADMPEERKEIVERLDDYERQMTYDYIPGFEEFVKMLKKRGVATALVTSSNHSKMECVYRAHPDFGDLFDAVLTSEDFDESKPSPDCYLKAAARLGVCVEGCIVCEDSFNGLRSGRAADMAVVGLATTNPRESIASFCDTVVDDFQSVDFAFCEEVLRQHASSLS